MSLIEQLMSDRATHCRSGWLPIGTFPETGSHCEFCLGGQPVWECRQSVTEVGLLWSDVAGRGGGGGHWLSFTLSLFRDEPLGWIQMDYFRLRVLQSLLSLSITFCPLQKEGSPTRLGVRTYLEGCVTLRPFSRMAEVSASRSPRAI